VLVIFHSKCAAVLNLDENHLTGTLPSNIGSLAALSESSEVWLSFMTIKVIFSYTGLSFLIHTAALSMSGNSLRGTIPNEITSLTLLNLLNLYENNLTGTIPSNIGSLTALTSFSFSGNSLTGTIPIEITNLILLDSLYLQVNNLRGTIPTDMDSLTKLTWLSLYDNSLTGEFTCPAFVDNCYISCNSIVNEACRSL
jgi:Leucine-rich repeat (LRR) protein